MPPYEFIDAEYADNKRAQLQLVHDGPLTTLTMALHAAARAKAPAHFPAHQAHYLVNGVVRAWHVRAWDEALVPE